MSCSFPKSVCSLAEALEAHTLGASLLAPFVLWELGATCDEGAQTTEFVVTLEEVGAVGKRTEHLSLQWSSNQGVRGSPPLRAHRVTQFAAQGIACAVLWHYTGQTVEQVATPGEGFDFWITGDGGKQGLKVGGTRATQRGALNALHRDKQRQLFSALSVGGYVVAVGSVRREIIISYHSAEEFVQTPPLP